MPSANARFLDHFRSFSGWTGPLPESVRWAFCATTNTDTTERRTARNHLDCRDWSFVIALLGTRFLFLQNYFPDGSDTVLTFATNVLSAKQFDANPDVFYGTLPFMVRLGFSLLCCVYILVALIAVGLVYSIRNFGRLRREWIVQPLPKKASCRAIARFRLRVLRLNALNFIVKPLGHTVAFASLWRPDP